MDKLIKKAVQELEDKAEELKKELRQQRDVQAAVNELELKKQKLVSDIECLTTAGMPKDLVDFYVEGRGKIYVSKIIGIERDGDLEIRLQYGAYNPFYPDLPRFTPGAYRLILLCLSLDVKADKDGFFIDELGRKVNLLRDC